MKHALHTAFKGAAEALMPLRTSSSSSSGGGFRETGLLSPEEYVAAGDFLVATCPTWSWAVRWGHALSRRTRKRTRARATPLPRRAAPRSTSHA
jgi:hypothetical protein